VATESSLVYIAINGAISLKVTDWLALGAGLQVLYTKTTSKAKINNFAEGLPDGQVEYKASGVGIGGVVSALIEFDQLVDFEDLIGQPLPLRMGLTYRPKTETDIDGVPEIKGAGPLLTAALAANGLLGTKIELKTTSPQMVGFGLYVEPIEKLSVAFDFAWIDMEQFGNVDITVSDLSTHVSGNYRDTYATAISFGWAIHPDVDLLAGFAYLSPAIADSKRTLSLPIDRIYVIGVGTKYRPRDWFELFAGFNYYDTGDSRVDTEPSPRTGRIAGESSPHFAVAIDLGLTFRF
jgi:long-chain fatty acid transport protein